MLFSFRILTNLHNTAGFAPESSGCSSSSVINPQSVSDATLTVSVTLSNPGRYVLCYKPNGQTTWFKQSADATVLTVQSMARRWKWLSGAFLLMLPVPHLLFAR